MSEKKAENLADWIEQYDGGDAPPEFGQIAAMLRELAADNEHLAELVSNHFDEAERLRAENKRLRENAVDWEAIRQLAAKYGQNERDWRFVASGNQLQFRSGGCIYSCSYPLPEASHECREELNESDDARLIAERSKEEAIPLEQVEAELFEDTPQQSDAKAPAVAQSTEQPEPVPQSDVRGAVSALDRAIEAAMPPSEGGTNQFFALSHDTLCEIRDRLQRSDQRENELLSMVETDQMDFCLFKEATVARLDKLEGKP